MSSCSDYEPHQFKRNKCRTCNGNEADHPPIPDDPRRWSVSDVSRWLAHPNPLSPDFYQMLIKFQIDGSKLLDDTYIKNTFRKFISGVNDWGQFNDRRSRLLGEVSSRNSAIVNNVRPVHTVLHSTASSSQLSSNLRSTSTIEDNNNITRQIRVPATTSQTDNVIIQNDTNYHNPTTNTNEMISTDLGSRITSHIPEREPQMPAATTVRTNLNVISAPNTTTQYYPDQSTSYTTMAAASNSVNREIHRIRRTLFMGSVGSGKSTIINELINDDVTPAAMSFPAMATDTSSGVTDAFNTYHDHDIPNNAYTDSIGFGDNRFSSKDSMQSLKSVLENSTIGYNKIYICVQYGRISKEIRKYIHFIETIFGASVLKHSSIIFTHCHNEKMTKEEYLSKNVEDVKMVEIIGKVKSVIFGNNQTDQDPQLEAIFKKRRQVFLNRIKQDLDETATEEYLKLSKKGILGKVCQAMKLFFGRKDKFAAVVNDIMIFTKAFADKMPSSKYSNYFGICSICQENMTDKNKTIITKCHHLYHEHCLMQWIHRGQSDCPLCRENFIGSIQESFMPLTINA